MQRQPLSNQGRNVPRVNIRVEVTTSKTMIKTIKLFTNAKVRQFV